MANALSAPVYEVRQDSEWYQQKFKRRQLLADFFKEINNTYFKDNGFSFYSSTRFGVHKDSRDFEMYKNELKKQPTEHGVHLFKENTVHYKVFKELLQQIGDDDPFKSHNVFGINNISKQQWVGDRWFFGVKDESQIEGNEAQAIDYKKYLTILMENMED